MLICIKISLRINTSLYKIFNFVNKKRALRTWRTGLALPVTECLQNLQIGAKEVFAFCSLWLIIFKFFLLNYMQNKILKKLSEIIWLKMNQILISENFFFQDKHETVEEQLETFIGKVNRDLLKAIVSAQRHIIQRSRKPAISKTTMK